MNNFVKSIGLIFVGIVMSIQLSADQSIPRDCQAEYLHCAKNKLDEIWSIWGPWYDKQLQVSPDELDNKQLDKIFDLYACDEVTHACESNQAPDLKRYLAHKQSQSETDWSLSKPIKEGVNDRKIQAAILAAASIPDLRSVIIAKNGKIIAEEYYSRKEDLRPQHIQSITKSITSLLIGIAIDKGFIPSEKERIEGYFPEYFARHDGLRKKTITIEQLLTMTSGLNFVDNPAWSKYKDSKSWHDAAAWINYWYEDNFLDQALHVDMVESDDEVIVLYNTPSSNLLTTILTRSTNMTSKEFADKYLFGPLGINNYFWLHDSNYNYVGGHTIFMRPRDLARVGQMILNGGSFQGQQLVSMQWLEKSFDSSVTKFVQTDNGEQVFDYGYLWYTGAHHGYNYQFAWGFGGQFLFLVPEANTLIVTTAFPDTDGLTHWEKSQKIIEGILLTVIDSFPEKTHR